MGCSSLRIANELAKQILQRQRRGRRAHLGAVNHEDIGIPAVAGPAPRLGLEIVERDFVVARQQVIAHALQTSVSEACRVGLDGRKFVGILEDDSDVARVRLIAELRNDLGVNEDAIPVVLRLLDQVYGLRRALAELNEAIQTLPESAQDQLRAYLNNGDEQSTRE